MKWIILIVIAVTTTGCCTMKEVVEYQQVTVVSPVVEPVLLDVDGPPEPLDVTTTTIDFY
ncbi:hypothetical protein EP47_04115 [Legionella norrlandica]|uniref:Uncharacterized protein n=1 Tax=Legionella norrlandica TaxID=1498499 RepID=A0A0A2SXR4_9GAMM|nr:hypothetical protein [Legionella norrlandica]KGP64244.1 hypothetical protein EP47_04115 [Legionella norrlandica]